MFLFEPSQKLFMLIIWGNTILTKIIFKNNPIIYYVYSIIFIIISHFHTDIIEKRNSKCHFHNISKVPTYVIFCILLRFKY